MLISEAKSEAESLKVSVTFLAEGRVVEVDADAGLWRQRLVQGLEPALWVRRIGPMRFVTLTAHPEFNLYQRERLDAATAAVEAGRSDRVAKLLADVERELGIGSRDLFAIGRAERMLGLMGGKTQAAAKGKRGRKASGLRDLSPEAARYAINKAALSEVRAAEELYKRALKMPGVTGGTPSLGRLLKGDLDVASILVADAGNVALQPVLRSSKPMDMLRDAGVPNDLLFVAKHFTADVEGSTIGKLTASYGGGMGGVSCAEPERLVVAMDRLVKAQRCLTRNQRFATWGALVFGLPLVDIGWALYGSRYGNRKEPLINAGAILLEGALEAMEPWYLAAA